MLNASSAVSESRLNEANASEMHSCDSSQPATIARAQAAFDRMDYKTSGEICKEVNQTEDKERGTLSAFRSLLTHSVTCFLSSRSSIPTHQNLLKLSSLEVLAWEREVVLQSHWISGEGLEQDDNLEVSWIVWPSPGLQPKL